MYTGGDWQNTNTRTTRGKRPLPTTSHNTFSKRKYGTYKRIIWSILTSFQFPMVSVLIDYLLLRLVRQEKRKRIQVCHCEESGTLFVLSFWDKTKRLDNNNNKKEDNAFTSENEKAIISLTKLYRNDSCQHSNFGRDCPNKLIRICTRRYLVRQSFLVSWCCYAFKRQKQQ